MTAFIFDLDGVVANTEAAHYRSWQRLADEQNIPFSEDSNVKLLGRNREDSLRLFLGDRFLDAATAIEWLERKQAYFLDELAHMGPVDALPGVVALLDEARLRGIPLGLASSSRNARAVLRQLDLTDHFNEIADGSTVSHAKPAPDIFLWVARALAEPPETCIVFEDSTAGIEAALAGGFPVIGLGATGNHPQATKHRADLHGARVDDFLPLATPPSP